MSSSFVHAPRTETGGSAVDAWLRDNWDSAVFSGADLIATHDGSRHPVKECAVVFRNFRPVAGAYFADPVAVVQYRSAMLTAIDGRVKYDHPVVRQNDVVVPLGLPDWTCAKTRTVLQQTARQWVSGGRNTADMSDEHVITLYYSVLQQLVFASGNATTAADQQRWFPALVALTHAFSAIHAAYEAARKVTAALVLTPGANDMIQKGLSYVFHSDAEWTPEARLDMLAIALRRNLRHSTAVLGMAPGPFALFVLVPLLRDVAHPTGSVLPESAALLERFNSAAASLLRAYVAAAAAPASAPAAAEDEWTTVDRPIAASRSQDFNVRVLVALTAAMGTPLSSSHVRTLLTHCTTTSSSDELNWADFGVVPAKPAFDAVVLGDRFAVAGRPATTFHVKVVPTASDWLNVYSYKGVEWAAVGFKTPGTYIVFANDLGIATRSSGDTRGRELTANWRITAGKDVLPASRPGYSLAGAEHKRLPSGRWDYTSSAPLSLETPFLVIVEPARVRLQQTGRLFFTMEKGAREPALLGFKNLWLRINYKAPEPVSPPPASTLVSSGRSWSSITRTPGAPSRSRAGAPSHEERVLDLPPTALMAKLRELAVADC